MISLQLFVLLPSKCSRVFLFYVGVLATSDVKFLTPHSNIDNKVINEPWRILFMNNNERKTERQIKSTQSEIPETNCLPSTVMTLCIRYLHLPHLFTLNLILRNWLIFMDFYSIVAPCWPWERMSLFRLLTVENIYSQCFRSTVCS